MEAKLMEMQKALTDNGVLIIFSGRFSQGIIEELGEALQKHMESECSPKNEIFNVFSVFIEQTQNIKNYTLRKSDSAAYQRIVNSGIVSIGRVDDGYCIWSGNLIENSDLPALKEKLDLLSSLEKDGLKKLYKEQLRRDRISEISGAGLGLIDMARKCRTPFYYHMDPIDNDVSFFELKAFV